MMLRVISIDHIEPFTITCSLNNGIRRRVDVEPLIKHHIHFAGISVLLDVPQFMKAEIGELGEIRWRNVVHGSLGELWDYDISPEYVLHNGLKVG